MVYSLSSNKEGSPTWTSGALCWHCCCNSDTLIQWYSFLCTGLHLPFLTSRVKALKLGVTVFGVRPIRRWEKLNKVIVRSTRISVLVRKDIRRASHALSVHVYMSMLLSNSSHPPLPSLCPMSIFYICVSFKVPCTYPAFLVMECGGDWGNFDLTL